MWRVRSFSLSGRVFSCFLTRSRRYSSTEKHAATPVCSWRPSAAGRRTPPAGPPARGCSRRSADEVPRPPARTRRRRTDPCRRGRSISARETCRKLSGSARERARFGRVDDIVGNGRDAGGEVLCSGEGRRTERTIDIAAGQFVPPTRRRAAAAAVALPTARTAPAKLPRRAAPDRLTRPAARIDRSARPLSGGSRLITFRLALLVLAVIACLPPTAARRRAPPARSRARWSISRARCCPG